MVVSGDISCTHVTFHVYVKEIAATYILASVYIEQRAFHLVYGFQQLKE